MEIAFVSSNKIYLEIEKNKIISFQNSDKAYRKPTNFIVTMLIGNTMATVVYGFYRQTVLLWLGICHFIFSNGFILLLQIVISTFVILITAEFLPKVFFKFMPIL
jgi:CBS domain containing-hemolysin-like protein